MKQSISLHEFRDQFRVIRPDNFSYEGLEAMFDYLEQYEEGTGEEIELDVIAICCDYSEYTKDELADDYSHLLADCDDLGEMLDVLSDHTQVIEVSEGIVILADF